MAIPTPDAAAAKWAQALGASTPRIQSGVEGVRTPPGQAAARQKQVWAQNVAAAQDKWAARVSSVGLTEWQQAVITKGIPRVASGATAAQPKMQAFMSQLLPYIASGVQALPPRGNLEQNIARMTGWVRHMSQFQRR